MLIKRLLKETLKVKRHKVVNVTYNDNQINVYMDVHKRRRLPCGTCQAMAVQR